ncbi:MAG TPA: hypothetical protein VEA37_05420 [Flavobacterium sp.]|nr:hypothetical protein [Flavobacterium sp.]
MKSIIIAGPQGSGKTTLADFICSIAEHSQSFNITSFDTKELSPNTEVLVLEEIVTDKDLFKFKEVVARKRFIFRPAYGNKEVAISPAIIGIIQADHFEWTGNRDVIVFNLQKL